MTPGTITPIIFTQHLVNQPSSSSSKSKSRVFLIELKKLLTAPVGTSSREPMVIPSIWKKWIKDRNPTKNSRTPMWKFSMFITVSIAPYIDFRSKIKPMPYTLPKKIKFSDYRVKKI